MVLASLAACATPFNADVSRFQTQLPAPQGESYFVVADDPALAGGLEFAQYADLVEAQMSRLGYAQAASAENASLLVRFDYGVSTGRERVRTTGFRDPFYDPWFGSRWGRSRFGYGRPFYGSRWGFGFYDPWFGGPDVRSYTVYTSGIDMKIDRAATGERL
ncbi:MAG: lipoprotein transmembrane, partial [Citromicrobium sp.]|nr:lipoprotein transmembrane [Citromicrobium sp.]